LCLISLIVNHRTVLVVKWGSNNARRAQHAVKKH